MGSKREEERNEKIIRGLMKLPPNRRCINCNSVGPQYVCTTFWTFVCVTCSGIHREFTHRVKSVSMSKFNSQEVDALQKGGNQRARESYLKDWDPERQRLPNNSNVDKIREFIKKVYVEKSYAVEKSLDRPPKDSESLRSHEPETRRASSYHSYSQSPPYDFQYEERRYGKHVTSVTRKPGSDHIIYEGRLSNFSSPSRSSDNGNNESFTNEGSMHRSFSSGVDLYRSNIPSRSPQTDIGSPFSETSSNFSRETPAHPDGLISSSDADNGTTEGRKSQPQRGSFESFDAMSFKSVNSSFLEVVSEPEKPVEISHQEPSSVLSLPQSSTVAYFSDVDLFCEPIVPQSVTSTPSSVCETQLSAAQSFNIFQQTPTSSAPMLSHQTGVSSCSEISDAVHHNGGWATFDMPQNLLSPEDFILAIVPSTGGNNPEKYNPFSLDQYSSSQDLPHHEPSGATYTLNHDGPQNYAVEPISNNAQFWNAFENSSGQQPTQNALESTSQHAQLCLSDATKSLANAVYAEAGVPVKPSNPFDLPCDSDFESNNMYWNMSSLQAALPNNEMPTQCNVAVNRSCFLPFPVPSYVNGGINFGPESVGPFGFTAGQTPSTYITNIHTEAPVASVGGNPFA